VEPFTTSVPKGPLNGDPLTSAEAFLKLKFEWKHPLISPLGRLGTAGFQMIPGLSREQVLAGAIALLAMLVVLSFHMVVRPLLRNRWAAMAASSASGLTLASLCLLGVPESYAASILVVLLFLFVWLRDELLARPRTTARLGLIAGVAGLANVPLLMLAGIPALRVLLEADWARAVRRGTVVAALGLLTAGTVLLGHGWLKHGSPLGYVHRAAEYGGGYADIGRLADPAAVAQVLACFLVFAVASPIEAVPARLGPTDLRAYLGSAGGAIGLAAVGLTLTLAIAALFGRHARVAICLWAWIAAMIGFYVFFNPKDAMLYSVQTQPALLLLAALGAASVASVRASGLLLLALVILLAARNLPIVLQAPYAFPLVARS
jgi:hypothetical protein